MVGVVVVLLSVLVIIWRIDSPRVERIRMTIIDSLVPNAEWVMAPVTGLSRLITDFQSYQRLTQENVELRRELQKMTSWQEAAIQLDQENAKLRNLNNVQVDPKLTFVTGVVLADSGSPFRQSVLLNIGARDGIIDGWPAMDGIGLVGRISGVGQETSRVLLLTDTSSRIPVTIQGTGQTAILSGDNTLNPPIDFLENPELVRAGNRVITSGDGGVFPADLLVGQVVLGTDRRLRVRLAADYERLEFLRVLRSQIREQVHDIGGLLLPETTNLHPIPTEENDDG